MQTEFRYDHYYAFDEVKSVLTSHAEKYPNLCELRVIGKSQEGREIFMMALTDKSTGKPEEKPALHVDGNTHAAEVTGSMASLHLIDTVLTNANDPKIASLLSNYTLYVIPRLSPDGAEVFLTTPYRLRSVNKEYNTKDTGVYQEDIDGDGVIRMMRIKTPTGAWKVADGPLGLTRRAPDDREGEFFDVYLEGSVENYDGITVSEGKAVWGLDFNRNYPFGWFAEHRQSGAGKYPLSEPETKAVVDFVVDTPNIGAVLTLHTYGGVLLYPPGTFPSKKASQMDMLFYKEIGKMCEETMGYPVVNLFDSFMKADEEHYSSGAFDDWCYHTQGVLAYTLELWDILSKAGKPNDWATPKEETIQDKLDNFAAKLSWIEKNAAECIEPWRPFDHPALGTVEIGGIDDKFCATNPPSAFLLEEVEKTTAFALRYLAALPRLTMEDVSATKLQDDVWRIDALVANYGYLPTYVCEEAKKIKVDKPVKVSIDGGKLLSGEAEVSIGDLAGYAQTNVSVWSVSVQTTKTKPSAVKVSWTVSGKTGDSICVKASQPKSGIAEKTITLA